MGLAVLPFNNNFIDKYQAKQSIHIEQTLAISFFITMNMFEALKVVTPPPVFSLLSLISKIIFVYVCIIAFSIMLLLIVIALLYVICEFVWTPFYERRSNPDPEAEDQQQLSRPNNGAEWNDQATFYQAAVLHNLRVLEILDSIVEVLEERRDERQQRVREQVLESKMPPPIAYGSQETEINCKDCVICMEDFENDQLCQVFPSCNHTFHSNCMNTWLKKSLTCPICRNSVLDL
ncbi:hypothetical protein DVH24_003150 [Malus domestica]|uniref:RING-type domain-containing protein n=2 Tax=Malus TaxID=3749 RepID=A0A498KC73_MALDO|nr:hypothetical protein DVH24_003150 [Malus domestica]